MEENKVLEIAEEVAEVAVDNGGLGFAKKCGIVGGVVVVSGLIVYGTTKLVKKIKTKKAEAAEVEGEEVVETSDEETK